MTKISTDRVQGEQLAAMGFDPGTADLWATEEGGAANFYITSCDGERHCFRAWSLEALMGLLPESIKDRPWHDYALWISSGDCCYCHVEEDGDTSIIAEFREPATIDAVFNMLCWLVEKGYVNKKEGVADGL